MDNSGRSLAGRATRASTEPCGFGHSAGILNAETLEDRLQRLLVEKGIRQIVMMNDGTFSIVRIGYEQRGFGQSLSEAYANCKGLVQ